MRRNIGVFFGLVCCTVVCTQAFAGIFKMEYDGLFSHYQHPEIVGKKTVSYGPIKLGIKVTRGFREQVEGEFEKPFTGGLTIESQENVKVYILDMKFIEKVNSRHGRILKPLDVRDDELLQGRKSTLKFTKKNRQLPAVWSRKSGKQIYMDFPPIPEDIKEGEIYVKLKIESDEGVEFFEQSFPVYQKTFIGKKRIFD